MVTLDVPVDFHDLSLEHSLLGSLTGGKRQLEADEWRQHQLPNEKVEEFWERGYLANVRVLTEEQCDQILSDYQHFLVSDWVVMCMCVWWGGGRGRVVEGGGRGMLLIY